MNKLTKAIGICSMVLALGCSKTTNLENKTTTNEMTIAIKPITVATVGQSGILSIYSEIDGKSFLATCDSDNTSVSSQGTALVLAVIEQNRFNNVPEKIEITGSYADGIFKCNKLKIKEYVVELKR
jgi:hypothetical protein